MTRLSSFRVALATACTVVVLFWSALLGQSFGPNTKVVVTHSGLDAEGNPETIDYYELRIIDPNTNTVVVTIGIEPSDAAPNESAEAVLGAVVGSLNGDYRVDVHAVDDHANVSTPFTLPVVAFDSIPPAEPTSLRINGIVTLEPVNN